MSDANDEYSVAVWDVSFCKMNADGEPLRDAEGDVIIFDLKHGDFSDLADVARDGVLEQR